MEWTETAPLFFFSDCSRGHIMSSGGGWFCLMYRCAAHQGGWLRVTTPAGNPVYRRTIKAAAAVAAFRRILRAARKGATGRA